MSNKYTYEIDAYNPERSQAFIAQGLKAIANEKAIANNLKELELMILSGDKSLMSQAIDRLKGK